MISLRKRKKKDINWTSLQRLFLKVFLHFILILSIRQGLTLIKSRSLDLVKGSSFNWIIFNHQLEQILKGRIFFTFKRFLGKLLVGSPEIGVLPSDH